jgi:circadian clock protein KaiB
MSPGRSPPRKLKLRLYVAGASPNSTTAIRNLSALLERHAPQDVELELVDVLTRPEEGLQAGILVTPTMVKLAPSPQRRIVGNLRDTDALLSVLGLTETDRE